MKKKNKGKKTLKLRYVFFTVTMIFFLFLFSAYYSLPYLLESTLNPILQNMAENGSMNLHVKSVGLFSTTFEFSAIPGNKSEQVYSTKVEQGTLRYLPFEFLIRHHLISIEFHKIVFPLRLNEGKMEMPIMRMLKTSASPEKRYMLGDLPFTFGKWIMDGELHLETDFLKRKLVLPFRSELNTNQKKWPDVTFELVAHGPHSYIRTFGDWGEQILSGILHAQIDPNRIVQKQFLSAVQGKVHLQLKYMFDLETASLTELSANASCKLDYVFTDTGSVIRCNPRVTLQSQLLDSDLKADQVHLHCNGLQIIVGGHPVSISSDFFWNWSDDTLSGKTLIGLDNAVKPQLNLTYHARNVSKENLFITGKLDSAEKTSIDILHSNVHYKIQKLNGTVKCDFGREKTFDFQGDVKNIEISDPTMKLTADSVIITAFGTHNEAKLHLATLNFKGEFPEEKTLIEMPKIETESIYKNGMLKFTCKGKDGTFEMGNIGVSAHQFSGHLPGEYKDGKFTTKGFLVSDDTSLYGYLMGKTFADVDWNNRNIDIKFRGKNTLMKGQYDSKFHYGENGWEKPKNKFHANPHTPRETLKYTSQYLFDASKHIVRCDLQSLVGYDVKRSFLFPDAFGKSLDYLTRPFKYTADVIWSGIQMPGKAVIRLYKQIIPQENSAEN